MATFMINGEILDIREQIGMHFGKAIEAAEEGGISRTIETLIDTGVFKKQINGHVISNEQNLP